MSSRCIAKKIRKDVSSLIFFGGELTVGERGLWLARLAKCFAKKSVSASGDRWWFYLGWAISKYGAFQEHRTSPTAPRPVPESLRRACKVVSAGLGFLHM